MYCSRSHTTEHHTPDFHLCSTSYSIFNNIGTEKVQWRKFEGCGWFSSFEGQLTHHLFAHSRFGLTTVHTRVNDISGNPWSQHYPCLRPHTEECASNAFVVRFMGFSRKKGADPRIVGDQRHTGPSLGNGLDSTMAYQEPWSLIFADNESV